METASSESLANDSITIQTALSLTTFDKSDPEFVRWLETIKQDWDRVPFGRRPNSGPFRADDPIHVTAFQKRQERYLQQRQEKLAVEQRLHAQMMATRREIWQTVVGARYAGCTFETFQATTKAMKTAVGICRGYAAELAAGEPVGNLVLFGGCGSGKDHLAVAVCRALFGAGWKPLRDDALIFHSGAGWPDSIHGEYQVVRRMKFATGSSLLTACRDAMGKHEAEAIAGFSDPELLVLSDPTPPSGDGLTGFQSSALASVIDNRYRNALPTIVTINCRDRDQMNQMLTTPISDRLCDGALTVACDWPSYRKSLKRKD